jgi:hypothetical protein
MRYYEDKMFTMSMFAKQEDLLLAKVDYYVTQLGYFHNALMKACGDDEQMVKEYLMSVGAIPLEEGYD